MVGTLGKHYVKLTLPLRKAATLLRTGVVKVCQQLDHLEWDFIQARTESQDIDSLGWTDREFSCLGAILDHKRGGASRPNPVLGIKYHSGY